MNDDENWEMAGFCPQNKDPGFGEFVGQVDAVLPSGCCFVKCQEVKDLYDVDAYVHSSVVQQCSLQPGEEICFNVHVSSAGRPQVSAPCWKRRQGLKRPLTGQAGGFGGIQGANGGKSVAKGQSGAWQRPGGEVVKARRLVESLNPSGQGKGMGNGNAAVQAMQMAEPDQGFPVDDAAQFLIGTIKITNFDPTSRPAKDFSLIACPETGLPQDVYVRGAVATSQAFAVGDMVAFAYHMTEKGPQATAVFKLVGFLQAGREVQFPPYQGLIHRVLPNGNGFIKCDAITAEYGKDAFIHASVVQQCGLNEQDIIAFDVHISKEGNPQASAPCWQQIAPTSNFQAVMQAPQVQTRMPGAFQSVPMAGKGAGKAPLGKGGKAPGGRPPTLTLSKGGTVRVQGPTTQAPKGGAWMGAKGQALPPGPLKGMPAAPKPKPLLSKGWPAWPAKGTQKGLVAGGQGPARDSWGAEAAANQVDDLEIDWMPDEFHAGRVCLVDVTKNVSMVRCPASNLSRDVYVHQSVAEPSALAVNDVVCFKIHTNKHGLPQASAPLWKRIGTDATDSVVRFGEFQGLVVRLDDGSISIDCAEVIQLHGKDASMSEESMNACGLVEGNFISFEVSLDDNGDPQALPPCWICCSSERWVKDLVGAKEESLANSV